MKTFFDSSALAKRYVLESGSQHVDEILQQTASLGVSVIIVPEVFSALNRRRREGLLTASDYAIIKHQLAGDLEDADTIELSAKVLARSVRLLENHPLRGMDSLHVACALEWRADIFVSSDQRQLAAANEEGLEIQEV